MTPEHPEKAATTETELMLKGYGLTTAEMFYHMPDYPHVLNTFVWQDYDLAPDHARPFRFIEFWQAEIRATPATISKKVVEGGSHLVHCN